MFIDAYLGLCTAIDIHAGTAIETAVPGYARQPIKFGALRDRQTVNATSWTFGYCKPGPTAGRAIYPGPVPTAPDQTLPMLILPFASPRPTPAGGPADAGDVGDIVILLSGLPDIITSATRFKLLAGFAVGQCWDRIDTIALNGVVSGGGYAPIINKSTMLAGSALRCDSGLLQVDSAIYLTV